MKIKSLLAVVLIANFTIQPLAIAQEHCIDKQAVLAKVKKVGTEIGIPLAKATTFATLAYVIGNLAIWGAKDLLGYHVQPGAWKDYFYGTYTKAVLPMIGIYVLLSIQMASGKTTLDKDAVDAIDTNAGNTMRTTEEKRGIAETSTDSDLGGMGGGCCPCC